MTVPEPPTTAAPTAPQRSPRNLEATAAPILGLLGLLVHHITPAGYALGIAAVILGVVGMRVGIRRDVGFTAAMFGIMLGLVALAATVFSAGGDAMFG